VDEREIMMRLLWQALARSSGRVEPSKLEYSFTAQSDSSF
jgi:hypothetical protein